MTLYRKCPVCHSRVSPRARKCRHCHNYLGFSFQWVWEEGIRVLGLVAMVAAAIVAWKSLELTMLAVRQREEAVSQVSIARRENDALKEDLVGEAQGPGVVPSQALAGQEKRIHQAWEKSSDVRVRRILAQALKLQGQKVRFRMGGKSPEEGFDSSGFVSFLLAEAGVLDPMYHRTFSVARLEKTFPKIKPGNAKPGDLVFLGASFVAINLGANSAVGIGSSKGIQVFSFSPKAKGNYHRWAYEQDSKLVK